MLSEMAQSEPGHPALCGFPQGQRARDHPCLIPFCIGIVAGETSGDILAAGLVRELQARLPDAQFEGIAGPRMQARREGAVRDGGALRHGHYRGVGPSAPASSRYAANCCATSSANPPTSCRWDAPDFNIGVELKLRRAGIKTVHYVSPPSGPGVRAAFTRSRPPPTWCSPSCHSRKPSTTVSMPPSLRRPHHGGRHSPGPRIKGRCARPSASIPPVAGWRLLPGRVARRKWASWRRSSRGRAST